MGQGTSLRAYLLTRLALVIPMVLILLTIVFLLMRVAPGDPISASLGGHAPQIRGEQAIDIFVTKNRAQQLAAQEWWITDHDIGVRPLGFCAIVI